LIGGELGLVYSESERMVGVTVQMPDMTHLGSGIFITDRSTVRLGLTLPSGEPLTLTIIFTTDTSKSSEESTFSLIPDGPLGATLELVNADFPLGGGGVGPMELGYSGNKKVYFVIWAHLLNEDTKLRRLEYSFYEESKNNG